MAYTADVNRWRGPDSEPYRPHMLDSPWHPGWIAVTILGFIIWWPIGLALLFFTLGSRKWLAGVMAIVGRTRWSGCSTRWNGCAIAWSAAASRSVRPPAATAPSTSTAWKPCGGSRKSRPEFRDFLDRLRHAKDKEEFDQFMAQHRQRPTPPPQDGQPQA